VLLLLVQENRLVSCQGFVSFNAAKRAKGTKLAKDSYIDGSRSVRQGNEVRQGLLILSGACQQNILGALGYPGEQNLTHVAFSKKYLAHYVTLAPLEVKKYLAPFVRLAPLAALKYTLTV
jgi:hypothetical protein